MTSLTAPASSTVSAATKATALSASTQSLRTALVAHAEAAARKLYPDAHGVKVSVADAALFGVPLRLDRVAVQVEVTKAAGEAPVALEGDVRVNAQGRPVEGRYGLESTKEGARYVEVKGEKYTFGRERSSRPSFADTFAEQLRDAAQPQSASSFIVETAAQPANFITRGEVENLLSENLTDGLVTSKAREQVAALRASATVSSLPDTLSPKQMKLVDARVGAPLVLSAEAAKLLDQALEGTAPAVGLGASFWDSPTPKKPAPVKAAPVTRSPRWF